MSRWGFRLGFCPGCEAERMAWLGPDGATLLCVACDTPLAATALRGLQRAEMEADPAWQLVDVTEGMPEEAPCGGCGGAEGGCESCPAHGKCGHTRPHEEA